jgi:thiamine biosynthesis protein ThiI
VRLEHPDLTVYVEVLHDRILYSFERQPGAGGFPGRQLRTRGRAAFGRHRLPGGGLAHDEAGCTVLPIHFHAFPLQDRTTIDKVTELARILTRYQLRTRLLLVPFGEVQQTIVASCPRPAARRPLPPVHGPHRGGLAGRHKARALVTGESLGQVASQTLDNMTVIGEAARGLVLRPLVGMDKSEITDEARRIGTFEVSTLPDQDCCQLFVPRQPRHRRHREEVARAERRWTSRPGGRSRARSGRGALRVSRSGGRPCAAAAPGAHDRPAKTRA